MAHAVSRAAGLIRSVTKSIDEEMMLTRHALMVRFGGLVLSTALAATVGSVWATHDLATALRVGAFFAVAASVVVGVIALASLPLRSRTRLAKPSAAADSR